MVVSRDGEVGIARLVLTIDNNGAKKLSSHVNIILLFILILIILGGAGYTITVRCQVGKRKLQTIPSLPILG